MNRHGWLAFGALAAVLSAGACGGEEHASSDRDAHDTADADAEDHGERGHGDAEEDHEHGAGERTDRHDDEADAHGHEDQEHEHEGEEDRHGHDDEHDHARHEGEHHTEGVRLTAGQMRYFGVTVAEAGPGSVDLGIRLPGEIRPNGDRLAHIVPRFPGIVREVHRTIGDQVAAGDVLAVVESSESLAQYELKTMIAGTVIEKHLTRGEAVGREEQAFVVADLTTVWVDLSVYQKDVPHVRTGMSVHIDGGPGLPEASGTISYITPVVDQPTRTATARVVLPNAEGIWRPGMFVNAHVLDPTAAEIVVPRTAIQLVARAPVVFVETGGAFEPRPIIIGRGGDTHVEVVDGLRAGERFVATNSFLLKAELGKGEAEHEH